MIDIRPALALASRLCMILAAVVILGTLGGNIAALVSLALGHAAEFLGRPMWQGTLLGCGAAILLFALGSFLRLLLADEG